MGSATVWAVPVHMVMPSSSHLGADILSW
jgi:hypothetical protein